MESIVLIRIWVLRSSLTLMEAQNNTKTFHKRCAQKPTIPRETKGSRSPRRVDKVDGVLAETDGERAVGLSGI